MRAIGGREAQKVQFGPVGPNISAARAGTVLVVAGWLSRVRRVNVVLAVPVRGVIAMVGGRSTRLGTGATPLGIASRLETIPWALIVPALPWSKKTPVDPDRS